VNSSVQHLQQYSLQHLQQYGSVQGCSRGGGLALVVASPEKGECNACRCCVWACSVICVAACFAATSQNRSWVVSLAL
jgi:hypothetical protein